MPSRKPDRPRVSFYLPLDLIQRIKGAAHLNRLTMGKLAEAAFEAHLKYLARRPPKRQRKGLRPGRPLKMR
jgi:hypothetical protein